MKGGCPSSYSPNVAADLSFFRISRSKLPKSGWCGRLRS
jgi:hypothetical protein